MPFDLRSFPNPDELAKAAAQDWLGGLSKRQPANRAPYTVALSGGRVTKTFFEEIVQLVKDPAAGLEKIFLDQAVHFFWADERCVPPTDPESNYAMAKELLFDPLKVPESQIHRLRGEGPEELALKEANESVRELMPDAETKAAPILDMVFLGMGEDGHVASLFPGEAESVMADPAIFRAVTAVKPPPRRITLGYGTIAGALDVRVLASGKGKEAALKESLSPAGNTPLARVLRLRSGHSLPTTIYTDIAV